MCVRQSFVRFSAYLIFPRVDESAARFASPSVLSSERAVLQVELSATLNYATTGGE